MPTIAQIQKDLKVFDTQARTALETEKPEDHIQSSWESLFHMPLSNISAKSFTDYYRKMRSSTRKMSGGMAPLSYTMTPGTIGVYGNFPTEISSDPASIQALDVFYQNSLNRGCGTENSSLPVPEDMGSNKVGGAKTRTKSRKVARKSYKNKRVTKSRKNARKTLRKGARKGLRRYKGGNLAESLMMHPYISSAPPNLIQMAAAGVSGATAPVPFPGTPVAHQWQYVSNGTAGLIDPGIVTPIGSDFAKLASPAPWQTSN
jgi:hypothetical protein